MATVQSQMNGFDPVLEDLPAWKKEIILRRRANAKYHGETAIHSGGKVATPQSPNSVTPLAPPQHILSCLGQGQSQLSVCSVQGANSSVRTVRVLKGKNNNSRQSSSQSSSVKQCLHHRGNCACVVPKDYDSVNELKSPNLDSNSMRGPTTMHHKGFTAPMDKIKKPEGLCNNDDEEFEYGPGIVSRLKNRYLSLALREAKGRASLRKYSSLEDLLDDGTQERGRSTEKERPVPGGNKHKDSMKRARSMDSLSYRRNDYGDRVPKSHSSGALRNALEKKEVIIIENIRPKDNTNGTSSTSKGFEPTGRKLHHQSSLLEEEELPAPDTVKQVKQIFESSGRVSKGTAAAKAASYKAAHSQKYPTIYPKPPIKAKPTQIQCKTISPTIENAKSSLKQVQPVVRSSPRSVLSVKVTSPLLKSGISPLSPKISGLTPITSSVTSPQVNGEKLSLIHSERNFKSIETPTSPPLPSPSVSSRQMYSRPHSPPPSLLPLSPTPTHKASTSENDKSDNDEDTSKETERVLQENRKNKEKSSIPVSEPRSPSPKSFKPQSPVKLFPERATENTDEVVTEKLTTRKEVHEHKETSAKPILIEKKESLNNSNSISSSISVPTVPPSTEEPLQSNPPSSSSSVMEVIRAAEAKSSSPAPAEISPLGLRTTGTPTKSKKETRRNSNENCPLVFNFSKRTETPDYIENDGVDLSKRQFKYKHEPGYVIMPGYDGKLDSSTDGDDDGFEDSLDSSLRNGGPPPPCNISFEGEGVIINGRSNLQRQPRTKKLEVSFDMSSTSTFEYPSENILVEEYDLNEIPGIESSSSIGGGSSSQSSIVSPSPGGLASYTPSKLKLNESFELGISRSTVPQPPTPPKEKESLEEELSHLRPADESQTVTWSSENAPDMLF